MSYGSCGGCAKCQTGRPWVCHDFWGRNFAATRADGTSALRRDGEVVHSHFFSQSSFATYAVANERNAVRLPNGIPFEVAAPFGCGIQTGAGAVFQPVRVAIAGRTVSPGIFESVALLGRDRTLSRIDRALERAVEPRRADR